MKGIYQIVFALSVLLLCSLQTQGQSKSSSQGSSNGRVVINGKDGQTVKTNNNGECTLIIPDWLLERIRKYPNKYQLKISVGKVPSKILVSKLSEKAKPGSAEDLQVKFSYLVTNGSKKYKGDNTELVNKSNIPSIASRSYELPNFALSNPNDSNVVVIYTSAGEPVPGAEIYLELEPDDEP